jgi:hypothetical protein
MRVSSSRPRFGVGSESNVLVQGPLVSPRGLRDWCLHKPENWLWGQVAAHISRCYPPCRPGRRGCGAGRPVQVGRTIRQVLPDLQGCHAVVCLHRRRQVATASKDPHAPAPAERWIAGTPTCVGAGKSRDDSGEFSAPSEGLLQRLVAPPHLVGVHVHLAAHGAELGGHLGHAGLGGVGCQTRRV